ncbi:MAG: hypothetical protein WC980_04580 [Candidatus Brocadiia bacterium]
MGKLWSCGIVVGVCAMLFSGACSGNDKPVIETKSTNPYQNAVLETSDGITGIKVKEDNRTVFARNKEGKELWAVDIIAQCGVPEVGEPVVRHISIRGDTCRVVFGKHSFAALDLQSGKIVNQGTD